MTDVPAQHLQVVIADDGTMDPRSRAPFAAWAAALQQAQDGGEVPRVVLACHGGLVGEAAGRTFAAQVATTFPDDWSLTFLTRTGLADTLGQLLGGPVFAWLREGVRRVLAAFEALNPSLVPAGEPVTLQSLRGPVTVQPLRFGESGTGPVPDQTVDAVLQRVTGEEFEQHREAWAALGRPQDVPNRAALRAGLLRAASEARRLTARRARRRAPSWVGRLEPFAAAPQPAPDHLTLLTPSAVLDANAWDAYITEQVIRELFPLPRLLWARMKQRMAAMLEAGGAGDLVVSALGPLSGIRVALLGHSLGGILADGLIRAGQRRAAFGQRIGAVIFLAPANTLGAVLAAPPLPHARYALMGLVDAEERNETGQLPWLLSGLYPRTLLYLISNALEARRETPLFGMEKYAGSSPQLRAHFGQRLTLAWVPDPLLGVDQRTHSNFMGNPDVQAWIKAQL
ncbi:hypothetical protein [Deinococcus budaensis]|uniref:Alpha/beta hydrolase n=1 Tax=Deinococcus budaensis TaxID=1665626 RepID=A0A7W8GEP0_9DEIO|nr:hypothetical protein [Deinococcus budaensis]MBB5233969.1 hypothetical protein [Deinococcus budaensis]